MTASTVPENQFLVSPMSEPEDMVSSSGHDEKNYLTLRETSPSWFWRVGLAAALLVVPAAYLVLLGIVAYLSGKTQSSFGDNTLEVLQLASTLWPISFAAVIGPFLKTLALFSAERGSTLGSLEFLLTSQTTVAAFKNLFALRHMHIWTIGIIAVWSFSPLGGQAAVRSLQLQTPTHTEQIDAMHYFSQVPMRALCLGEYRGCYTAFTDGLQLPLTLPTFRRFVQAAFSRADVLISHPDITTQAYYAATRQLGGISQAARLGRQDIWHNVRIPFMELLPGYDDSNPESWTPVPSDEIVPYSSFIGVPVRGGSRTGVGNSTMMLHTRYHTLSCGDSFNGSSWLNLNVSWDPHTGNSWLKANGRDSPLFYHKRNLTASGPLQHEGLEFGLATKPNLWLDFVKNNVTESHFSRESNRTVNSPLQLVVGGICFNTEDTTFSHMVRVCNITTSYVDVEVGCKRLGKTDDLNCQADRIRRTPHPGHSTDLADLSYEPISERLVYEMPFTTAAYTPGMISLLERYIHEPPYTFETHDGDGPGRYEPACYSELSQALFEARFSTALNTFLMASYNSLILTGPNGTSSIRRNHMWENTTATWMEFTDRIYVIDVPWFCISIISTIILLGCAIANAIVRQLILAPDFLDSIDGLTRDSPFVKIPSESDAAGSGVSSRDRLQATKDIRVQIRDVEPETDVGKIALTTETTDKRLRWDRAYM